MDVQVSCPITRGVHLEYVAAGRWRLTGDVNASEVTRDDRGWQVSVEGDPIGHYRIADIALSHAYSIASNPTKRIK